MITILYFLFGIFLVCYELRRKKQTIVDAISFVNLYWGTSYVLPAIVHGWAIFFEFESYYKLKFDYTQQNTALGFIACFLMYISIITTYIIFKKKSISFEYCITSQKSKSIYMSSIILVFSLVLFLLYAWQFGGPINLIANANAIRGGTITPRNLSIMFLNKLFHCVRLAPLLIIPFAKKNPKVKIVVLIFLSIAFAITMSSGSRGELLIFVMTLLLGAVIGKKVKRIKLSFVIKIGLIGYFGIVLLRPLIDVLPYIQTEGLSVAISKYIEIIFGSGKYSVQGFKGIMNNLAYSFEAPFVSMETALRVINTGAADLMYLNEWIASLLSPIPSILTGVEKPLILTVYNSYFISGELNMIQVPSGAVAAAYYSFGIFGPLFYGCFLGWVATKLDLFYLRIRNAIAFSNYYYIFILFIFFDLGLGGDWGTKFSIYFTTLIFIVLIRMLLFRKVSLNPIERYVSKVEDCKE